MAQINVISFEQIATTLAQLATNYGNLFTDYYNLFYNPVPMDVTIEIYNEDGNLETITIPNRAKDRTYILNGEGEPEGVVSAEKGSVYQDIANGIVYVKQFTTSDSTGWSELMTLGSLSEYLLQEVGSPEGVVTAAKGVLCIDRSSATLYIKGTDTGNTGWILISANTSNLANRDLSNLSSTGRNAFLDRSLGNLDTIGHSIIDGKENASNKTSAINASSTDIQYPTAKAVYDLVGSGTADLATRSLDNLHEAGEDHFVRTANQVRDCIFKAPNGLPSVSGNIISLPQGTILLCTNGVNNNKAPINEKSTAPNAISVSVSTVSSLDGVVLYSPSRSTLLWYDFKSYYRQNSQPSVTSTNALWYNPDDNTYKITTNTGSSWLTIKAAEIGRFKTNSSGNISSFNPYHPLTVATEDDIRTAENDIRATLAELKREVEEEIRTSLPVIEYY